MKTLLSWSSGKDSAWALFVLRKTMPDYDVVGLFCTVNAEYDRVAMHATRRALLEAQAKAAGLPLHVILIPNPCSHEQYAEVMADFVAGAQADGVECMAFGDLFLEDVRRYREEKLAGTGIEAVFPLWGSDTRELATQMLEAGVETYVCCANPKQVPAEIAGKRWDAGLIARLPDTADMCGENGEFHTVVADGPFFAYPLKVEVSEVVERGGYVFADVLLK
ncbi:ATP-binding protein [Crenobacter cavernae]|uniref:ATP-binding protein n=1 Tax=Crenobacter cavernae TaxID=2290923 RepID=A0ABY0FGP2_9NEIS|nr:ATP-binding protein [Crenobacter cavernae]RXZ45564.1 ATP-binding protein [Crenobacter cavernae]